jgi:hypothetical protein
VIKVDERDLVMTIAPPAVTLSFRGCRALKSCQSCYTWHNSSMEVLIAAYSEFV